MTQVVENEKISMRELDRQKTDFILMEIVNNTPLNDAPASVQ